MNISEAGSEGDVLRSLEAVFKAASVMIVELVLVLRIDILSANLPEERMELILVSVLLEIVEELYLFGVSLEVGPYIPVDGNNDLALEILGHSQNVDGGHLVLHSVGVLTEGAEGHINVIILAVLCKVDREMRVAGVIDVSAGGLEEIVDGLLVHVGRAYAGEILSVGTGGVCGDDAGPVNACKNDIRIRRGPDDRLHIGILEKPCVFFCIRSVERGVERNLLGAVHLGELV